jgi:hypothetical protein
MYILMYMYVVNMNLWKLYDFPLIIAQSTKIFIHTENVFLSGLVSVMCTLLILVLINNQAISSSLSFSKSNHLPHLWHMCHFRLQNLRFPFYGDQLLLWNSNAPILTKIICWIVKRNLHNSNGSE